MKKQTGTEKEWESFCKDPGFIVHSVIGTGDAHTHGIAERYNHPELELRLNIDPNLAMQVINQAGFLVSQGITLEEGMILSDFCSPGFDATVIQCEHGLRLVLCDGNGELEPDKMTDDFKTQYENLKEIGEYV